MFDFVADYIIPDSGAQPAELMLVFHTSRPFADFCAESRGKKFYKFAEGDSFTKGELLELLQNRYTDCFFLQYESPRKWRLLLDLDDATPAVPVPQDFCPRKPWILIQAVQSQGNNNYNNYIGNNNNIILILIMIVIVIVIVIIIIKVIVKKQIVIINVSTGRVFFIQRSREVRSHARGK